MPLSIEVGNANSIGNIQSDKISIKHSVIRHVTRLSLMVMMKRMMEKRRERQGQKTKGSMVKSAKINSRSKHLTITSCYTRVIANEIHEINR